MLKGLGTLGVRGFVRVWRVWSFRVLRDQGASILG